MYIYILFVLGICFVIFCYCQARLWEFPEGGNPSVTDNILNQNILLYIIFFMTLSATPRWGKVQREGWSCALSRDLSILFIPYPSIFISALFYILYLLGTFTCYMHHIVGYFYLCYCMLCDTAICYFPYP